MYFIRCPCGLSYVGETGREVRLRISEHRSAIKSGRIQASLVQHFMEKNHQPNELAWNILEKTQVRDGQDLDKQRKKREVFWIFLLETHRSAFKKDLTWENAIY